MKRESRALPAQDIPRTELRRVTFQHPVCHICSKHVDKFEMKRDYLKGVKLVAYCHNDISESPWMDESAMDAFYTYRAFLDPKRTHHKGRKLVDINPRDTNGFQWLKK